LSYIYVPLHHAKGGSAADVEYQVSNETCKQACSEVMNCMGYDWDEGSSPWKDIRCWLKNVEFSAIDGVNMYQKRNWKGHSISAFMKYLNFHAEGAIMHSEITTADDCASLCLSIETCWAFDYDTNENPWKATRCWLHENELEDWTNGNHQMKVPCPMA